MKSEGKQDAEGQKRRRKLSVSRYIGAFICTPLLFDLCVSDFGVSTQLTDTSEDNFGGTPYWSK